MKKYTLLSFLMGLSTALWAADNTQSMAKLTELAGASGFEKGVREYLAKEWQPSVTELKVDGQGNLTAKHKNNQKGPRVLLMAHMDEVGMMVESITPEGYIKVVPLGGLSTSTLYAQRWLIHTAKGPVLAYSGMDSPHLLDDPKKEQGLASSTALFLDVGAASKAQAENELGIRPGLQITPVSEFKALTKNRYLAKALDDRLGLALISDVLEDLNHHQQPNQLYLAATVQEEIGLRGASTVYESTHPDVALNIEVGIADDYPMLLADRKGRIALGKGPSLFVYDRTMIPNQGLLEWIKDLASKNRIPVQWEVERGYGEDGAKLQASGPGVITINIGIPIRYAHQQAGIFDRGDYLKAVKLVSLIVQHLNQQALDQIKAAS